MADDEGDAPQYVWKSAEPLPEGQEEPESANYVVRPGKCVGRSRAHVTYPTGDTFEGEFNDEKQKHGPGKYVWSKEVTEEGPRNAWVPVNEEGDAAALPEDRVIAYEGDYVEGRREGVGKMTYPNGDRYHGRWKNNLPEGEGTYYYKGSGDIYSGQWDQGKKHGRGAYVFQADESQLIGEWVENSFKSGKWVFKDGTSWHGSFRRNRPYGRGVFYFPNGNMQQGEYVTVGEDEEDPDADEDTPPRLLWRGEAVVPGTADSRDLLAPLPVEEEGESKE